MQPAGKLRRVVVTRAFRVRVSGLSGSDPFDSAQFVIVNIKLLTFVKVKLHTI